MSIDPFGDRRYQLRVYPADDDVFADAVREAFRAIGTDREQLEDRLELILRRTYPSTVVRPVDPLGQISGEPPAWYVYRDGSAAPAERSLAEGGGTIATTRIASR